MAKVKPLLDAAGCKLIAVGVGTPASALEFCNKVPFPQENLVADPDRATYKALALYEGVSRTFFNRATPMALLKRGDAANLREATKNYTLIMPKKNEDAFQQGGMFVFQGRDVLYARKDEGTADHAPMKEVLLSCCGEEAAAKSPVP